jgi:7-cyano-7-deazaguanine reductase
MTTVQDSLLGKPTDYAGHYDPDRLFPIERAGKRAELGIVGAPPFFGGDIWNAYELSWLDRRGRPRVALARIDVPADSPCIIESKSLKLYLNSFMQERIEDGAEVIRRLQRDLTAAAGAPVSVTLGAPEDFTGVALQPLGGSSIDRADADIDSYSPPQPGLLVAHRDLIVEETLTSDALKSNCPVTGQPDWASLQVRYHGPRIGRAGLLRYLASYREHADFHEHCVERIYLDLWRHCAPQSLLVYARYTRRGGLDINPWRSSTACAAPANSRTPRQ